MRARFVNVLRANPPRPRQGESPAEYKKRLDSYRAELRKAKERVSKD